MNPTLSRRAAQAVNAFQVFPDTIDRLDFAYAVEAANSFEDLSEVYQAAILLTEQDEPVTAATFANTCHSPEDGRFCETGGSGLAKLVDGLGLPEVQRAGVRTALNALAEAQLKAPGQEHGILIAKDGTVGVVVDGEESAVQVLNSFRGELATRIKGAISIHTHPSQVQGVIPSGADIGSMISWNMTHSIVIGPQDSIIMKWTGGEHPSPFVYEQLDKALMVKDPEKSYLSYEDRTRAGIERVKRAVPGFDFEIVSTKLSDTYADEAKVRSDERKRKARENVNEARRKRGEAPLPEKEVEALVASLPEFSNTCHSPADGRFCETHGITHPVTTAGSKPKTLTEKAPAAEQKKAKVLVKAKVKRAPIPTPSDVKRKRAMLDKIRAEGGRPGGDYRGKSVDRHIRQEKLWVEFGGPQRGYVVDAVSGVKMHYTDDPALNPKKYPEFTQGKIFTTAQGGGYRVPNLIPELLRSNQSRGDTPIRKENLDPL